MGANRPLCPRRPRLQPPLDGGLAHGRPPQLRRLRRGGIFQAPPTGIQRPRRLRSPRSPREPQPLSDDHHIALTKALPADGLSKARSEWQEAAQHWLRVAEEEGLSPRELQKSIKAGEIVRDSADKKPTGSGSTGILTLEAIHMDFLRWRSRSEDDGFPAEWNSHQLAKVKDLLAPMAEAFRAASTTLLQKGEA
jgi:hypothetical protein